MAHKNLLFQVLFSSLPSQELLNAKEELQTPQPDMSVADRQRRIVKFGAQEDVIKEVYEPLKLYPLLFLTILLGDLVLYILV